MTVLSRFGLFGLLCIISYSSSAQVVDTAAVVRELDSLIHLSVGLTEKKAFNQALEVSAVAEKRAIETLGRESAAYGSCCFNRGRVQYLAGKYPEAEIGYLESKSIREKALGKEHPDYAKSLSSLGVLYYDLLQYEKAETLYLEAKVIREKAFGKEHPDYAGSLNSLAILYAAMDQYEKAESYYLESKSIREKALGKEHQLYGESLNNLSNLYRKMGKYEKAERLQLEAIDIKGKSLGKENSSYAKSLNNLANLYVLMGQYEKAEPVYLEAISIKEKVLGKEQSGYAQSLNNLGSLYVKTGQYEKAEPLFLKAIAIREKALGKEHPDYAQSLFNLAGLYLVLGQLDKAEPLYLKTLDIQGKTLGKEHPDYADILLNLALLYLEMGHYEKAESLFLESKSLIEKSLGKEHSQFAIILIGMANLYRQMGQYEKAEPLFLQAKAIQEKSLGKEHTDYASNLNNLALMYFDLDEYEKAEPLFLRAKFIREKAVGKEHPDYANSLQSLAIMYAGIGLYEKAEPLFLELSYANKRLIEKASRFLSERELNDYLKAFLESQNQTLSFTQTPFGKILIPNCYDNSLFYKGLLLQSAGRIRQLILSDTAATEKINRLKGYQRRLAALYTLPIAERDSALVGDLETQANDIEKDLTRSVAAYGQAKQQVNWQEVKATLKVGEAALEFVHYKYSDKKAMYSTMYAVFVLRAQDTTPHFIPLFEEKQLQSFLEKTGDQAEATSSLYAARTGNLLGQAPTYGKELYNLIWRPLDSLMRGVKTVYFSPSGLLHRVAFAALPVDGKKVLSDKYELHQLGSTRSLVVKTLEPVAQNYTAAVFGGVQYDRKPNTLADSTAPEIKDNRLWTYINRQRAATNEGFDYLPGTAQEATRLTRALQAQRVQVQTFTAAQATEEMLKSLGRDTVKSPDILHIATHGFFFPDPEKRKEKPFGEENVFKWNENPLLRSGLALAGANAAWSGQPTLGNIEDGIATAYEISHLNLSNTKLVVLSACESGLGDIKGSEGVYGLQRAFKMAGADFLLVSLWQVPDKETVEFMNQFYQSWLGGKTIHEAFAKAQKKMRKKYKEVYKWGAWVLVE